MAIKAGGTRFGSAAVIQRAVRRLYQQRHYAGACTCDPKHTDPCVACEVWEAVGLPAYQRPQSDAERAHMDERLR